MIDNTNLHVVGTKIITLQDIEGSMGEEESLAGVEDGWECEGTLRSGCAERSSTPLAHCCLST